MKHCITAFILFALQFKGLSQDERRFVASFMDTYPLQICYNKTTNLVFPYSVKSVDRGSSDILVQKARYADTILQLKAGREGFKETNLSVVTTDGKLYSFLVQYAPAPATLNYLFNTAASLVNHPSEAEEKSDNERDFLENSKYIARNKKFVHGVRNSEYKMHLQLNGIYVSKEHIYLQLQIKNSSNLPYHIETLRFLIRDKKVARRTSTQEIEISPVYRYGNTCTVYGQSEQECVFVLPAFTISNSKYLIVEMTENTGGRSVGLKIKDRHILKAKAINRNS